MDVSRAIGRLFYNGRKLIGAESMHVPHGLFPISLFRLAGSTPGEGLSGHGWASRLEIVILNTTSYGLLYSGMLQRIKITGAARSSGDAAARLRHNRACEIALTHSSSFIIYLGTPTEPASDHAGVGLSDATTAVPGQTRSSSRSGPNEGSTGIRS